VVGGFADGTARPMAITMLCCAALAVLTGLFRPKTPTG
jgi:hypothetical protein